MPTSWHYKSLGQAFGPVSFRDLTRMVRHGELAADDLVRPDYNDRWLRADEVPGLIHMAHVIEAEPDVEEQETGEWDALDYFSEAELEELLPSEEQPAWMKRILERMWSGEAVSEAERERVLGFLETAVDSDVTDDVQGAAAVVDPRDAEVVHDESPAASLRVAEDFYGDAQPSIVSGMLAEMEADHEAACAAAEAKRRGWRCSLKDVASDRWLWRQVLRVGGAMLCANLAFLWLEHWTAREALRFPGLLEERGVRMFPVIGSCSPTEFWFFTADLILIGAGLGYAAVRWVQQHVD